MTDEHPQVIRVIVYLVDVDELAATGSENRSSFVFREIESCVATPWSVTRPTASACSKVFHIVVSIYTELAPWDPGS